MSLSDSLSEALQGRDIVDEVLFNSERGQFEFSERVIVPAVYHIFLHPDDFDRLDAIVSAIEQECKDGLNKRLQQLNRGRLGRKRIRYGIEAEDWEVRVFANYENGVEPGSVKVASSLAPAAEREFVGAVTVRVKHPAAARASAGAASVGTPVNLDGRETKRASDTRRAAGESTPAWGSLQYRDDEGEKTVALASPTAMIGRGSAMDVVIRNAQEEVSRQHCRIRRDASGEVFVTDLGSSNGTMLDGVKLAADVDTPLQNAAHISLANGAVVLTYTRRNP